MRIYERAGTPGANHDAHGAEDEMSGRSYSTYGDVRVVCPFFKGEEARCIRCEGVQRGSVLILRLSGEQRKRAYMAAHCLSLKGCGTCPINRMMTAVYAGGA